MLTNHEHSAQTADKVHDQSRLQNKPVHLLQIMPHLTLLDAAINLTIAAERKSMLTVVSLRIWSPTLFSQSNVCLNMNATNMQLSEC